MSVDEILMTMMDEYLSIRKDMGSEEWQDWDWEKRQATYNRSERVYRYGLNAIRECFIGLEPIWQNDFENIYMDDIVDPMRGQFVDTVIAACNYLIDTDSVFWIKISPEGFYYKRSEDYYRLGEVKPRHINVIASQWFDRMRGYDNE